MTSIQKTFFEKHNMAEKEECLLVYLDIHLLSYFTEKLHLHEIKDKLHLAPYSAPFKISHPGHLN